MPVIAFVNQKGGCSKSTTAVHFSCWLSRQGNGVQLLDADAQRSSSIWLNSIESGSVTATVLQSPDELLEQIPLLASQCDYLIVDGPAGLAEPTRAILLRTDLAVVPCQPTGLDLQSASDAIRLIKQAQSVRGSLPKAAIFLSRAVKGTKLKEEAVSVLNQAKEVAVLKSVIHQKQAIADTYGQAATIWEMTGRPAAESKREYEQLFKEILGLLK